VTDLADDDLAKRDTLPGRTPPSLRVVLDPPPAASRSAAIRLGFAAGLSRLRRRSSLLALALAVALVVVGALVERAANPAAAASASLFATFRLVVPLLAFAAVAEVTDRGRLDDAAWPIARYGAARLEVALGIVGAAAAGIAVACGALALVATLLAHGPADPPLARDVLTAAWIGALTGPAYVSWYAFGATFGKRGGGRYAPLLLDFIAGGSTGVFGALLPRGGAENLLGGEAPLGMSQPASAAALVAMTLALAALAALRARD
jgi:hypothetical protein